MNDTFNMNRFRLLVRRQWTENKKVYLLLWAVISLSLVVLSFFSEKQDLGGLYLLLFCCGGCVMASTLFSRWTDFGRSAMYLLLPASFTEKFLSAIFWGLILFIPAYILNFLVFRYFVTYLVVLLFPNSTGPFSIIFKMVIREIVSLPRLYTFVLLAFIFTQSLYMICLIRFRKRQVLIFLLILLGIVVVHNTGMRILMPNLVNLPAGTSITPGIFIFFDPGFGFAGSTANQPVSEYFSFISPIRNLNSVVWLAVFTLLYLAAFYKLKEREL
jgi:hypothetical protein